jgi:hypothetical protein
MTPLSYKYRIYIAVTLFAIFAIGLFLFGYDIFGNRNAVLAQALTAKTKEYDELEQEQRSFELGQRDLKTLESKPFQPDELFSKDTKVVKEIKTLETIAAEQGIDFKLQVSGTSKDAKKVEKTKRELFAVPYTVTLEGSYEAVMKFMESIEHLNFATHVTGVSINALKGDQVRAVLTAQFYIKK